MVDSVWQACAISKSDNPTFVSQACFPKFDIFLPWASIFSCHLGLFIERLYCLSKSLMCLTCVIVLHANIDISLILQISQMLGNEMKFAVREPIGLR